MREEWERCARDEILDIARFLVEPASLACQVINPSS